MAGFNSSIYMAVLLMAVTLLTITATAQQSDPTQPICPCLGGGHPGPAGPTGPPGAPGVTGPSGVPGVQGPQGMTGPMGNRGESGRDGDRGFKGEKGEAGLTGKAGEVGDRGPAGSDGERGSKGEKGDRGVAGSDGDKGTSGSPGPIGQKGAKGIQGEEGIAGAKGQAGVKGGLGNTGSKGIKGDVGDDGDSGADGVKGEKGEPGTPYTPPEIVMFTARRINRLDINSDSVTITYEAIELNIGEDFNRNSGIFTCRIRGLYFFTFCFWNYGTDKVDIRLMHNGYSKARAWHSGTGGYVPISYSLYLALDVGDEVSLSAYAYTDIQASTYGENSFSGQLVYPTDENFKYNNEE